MVIHDSSIVTAVLHGWQATPGRPGFHCRDGRWSLSSDRLVGHGLCSVHTSTVCSVHSAEPRTRRAHVRPPRTTLARTGSGGRRRARRRTGRPRRVACPPPRAPPVQQCSDGARAPKKLLAHTHTEFHSESSESEEKFVIARRLTARTNA